MNGAPIANDYIVWLDMFLEPIALNSVVSHAWILRRFIGTTLDPKTKLSESSSATETGWLTEFALWRPEDWNTKSST